MMNNQIQKTPNKGIKWDNIIGVIALAAVILTVLYVISTYISFDRFFGEKVEITYPEHILSGAAEEMAESMKGTDGVYSVKVNDDGSLTAKLSPERYQKILDAADNAANAIPITSISEESAIQSYESNEDHTKIKVTAFGKAETLESEIENIVYVIRLYHICNQNLDAKIEIEYTDVEKGKVFLNEEYDVMGKTHNRSEQYFEDEEGNVVDYKGNIIR